MATSGYLVDLFTRHQVFLERLKASEVRDLEPGLARLDRAITDRLAAVNEPLADLSPAELDRLVLEIFKEEKRVLDPWELELQKKLEEASQYELEFSAKALDEAVAGDVTIHAVSAADAWQAALQHPVRATGQLLASYIRSWSTRTMDTVEGVIRNAHAQGWTVDETARAIRGTKAKGYADGIVSGIGRQAQAVVRTSLQHVSNTSRSALFEANADIVTGERWIATLDLATCARCGALDQQVFDLGKGPRPPLHICCRCVMVPEMDSSLELLGAGKRAAKGAAGGEQAPATTTYYAWLKTQPAAFQDEAIGATRGALLRRGGLSAKDFARLNLGRNFAPMTLDEMRAKAPAAFDKANVE